MKQKYRKPICDVIIFECEDVMLESIEDEEELL